MNSNQTPLQFGAPTFSSNSASTTVLPPLPLFGNANALPGIPFRGGVQPPIPQSSPKADDDAAFFDGLGSQSAAATSTSFVHPPASQGALPNANLFPRAPTENTRGPISFPPSVYPTVPAAPPSSTPSPPSSAQSQQQDLRQRQIEIQNRAVEKQKRDEELRKQREEEEKAREADAQRKEEALLQKQEEERRREKLIEEEKKKEEQRRPPVQVASSQSLPQIVDHVSDSNFDSFLEDPTAPSLPVALLFTSQKTTTDLWLTLANIFHNRIRFCEARVSNGDCKSLMQRMKVKETPSVVVLRPGEVQPIRYSGETTLEMLGLFLAKNTTSISHPARQDLATLVEQIENIGGASRFLGSNVNRVVLVSRASKGTPPIFSKLAALFDPVVLCGIVRASNREIAAKFGVHKDEDIPRLLFLPHLVSEGNMELIEIFQGTQELDQFASWVALLSQKHFVESAANVGSHAEVEHQLKSDGDRAPHASAVRRRNVGGGVAPPQPSELSDRELESDKVKRSSPSSARPQSQNSTSFLGRVFATILRAFLFVFQLVFLLTFVTVIAVVALAIYAPAVLPPALFHPTLFLTSALPPWRF